MPKIQVTIKNVDASAFNELKAHAAREKMPVGDAVSFAIMSWISDSNRLNLALTDWKTIKGGKKTKQSSEQIDSILYGA